MDSKIDRNPAAQALSGKILNSFRIYVEGDSDIKYWRNILCPNVEIRSCNGWKKVIETVNESKMLSMLCVGIIDNDFRGIITEGYEKLPDNVFVTDDHDLEMTMYKTDAFDKIIVNSCPAINHNYIAKIKAEILEVVYYIGYIKIANKHQDFKLFFKKEKRKNDHSTITGSFDYPKYEMVFTQKMIKIEEKIIKDENQLIQAVINFNKADKCKQPLVDAFNAEKEVNYDKWLLGNGHDFTYLLMHLLKKGLSESMEMDTIEEKLYLAYGDAITETNLYNSIIDFCNKKDLCLFKTQKEK